MAGLLAICVLINIAAPATVPAEVTLFLLGCLITLGTSYSVRHPGSSLFRLSPTDEHAFRVTSWVISLLLDIVLVGAFLKIPQLDTTLLWLFAPIMALPLLVWPWPR
ncbi:MAG: hypothetical protein EP312_05195 [Gammaproteobacteria bacterium]|nr:MAG: hypothetical protein EP312_05195 [Gammaproteobacteria bacterium]